MKKMSTCEIILAGYQKREKEAAYLNNENYEVKKARIGKIKGTIIEYLENDKIKKSLTMESIIINLFDGDNSMEDAAYSLESDSIYLLKALANSEVVKALNDDNTVNRSIDMLFRINRFAASLKEESQQAELKLAFIEYDGTRDMATALDIENEYDLKLKANQLQAENL